MKRIAIFAHFDKKNEIQDYVIYYIENLLKISDKIIFISDSNLPEKELKKLKKYNNIYAQAIPHGEYDFGSYKRGFMLAAEMGLLNNCEEIILCNDSCYGPIFPFKIMFEEMRNKDIDFWGITKNPFGIKLINDKFIAENFTHIQSYFIVLKANIFNSEIFKRFILSVKKEKTKNEIIINYEQKLTSLLTENGFKYDYYCKTEEKHLHPHIRHYKKLLLKYKNPLIKRVVFNIITFKSIIKTLLLIRKYSDYDVNLIIKDLYKTRNFLPAIFSVKNKKNHKIITITGEKE